MMVGYQEYDYVEEMKAYIYKKVAIMSGKVYGKPGYLRLNCGCPRSKLEEGMCRIKMAMDFLHNS